MTKTAGRENQKRCVKEAASRDHGTEGQNNPVQWGGLDGKKTSGRRRSLFSLTPFIELTRTYARCGFCVRCEHYFCFSSAVQLTTTVSGSDSWDGAKLATTNFLPSPVTS